MSAAIRVNTARLQPLSVGTVSQMQAGTDDTQQIELIQLIQNAYVFNIIANAFPAAGVVVTPVQVGTSERPDIQRITLAPQPYDGTFDFTLAGENILQAPFDITGRDLQEMVGAAYVVTKKGANSWQIETVANGAIAVITVDVANLVVPKGVSGILATNTMGVWLAFVASQAKVLGFTLEVQLAYPGQDPQTVLQMPIEMARNVINLATLLPATTLGLQSTYSALFGGIQATWSTAITALTGGGTALDAVPTTALALGARYDFELNDSINSFVLKAGAADVDDPTGQVAPLDYNAGSNNRHWERKS